MKDNIKPYFKKNIRYVFENKELIFNVSQELFSSQEVDHGTQRLLRTISQERLISFNKCLDIGCGYGPIGIALKKINQTGMVHMTDIDALALEYTRQNAAQNGVTDVQIYGSLGYDNVTDNNFDLIVSNIPAKVGESVLSHMLLGARYHLLPDGRVVIVVIDAIRGYVSDVLETNGEIEILYKKSWPGHTVFHYRFRQNSTEVRPNETAFSDGIYNRTISSFRISNETATIQTVYNLPEFDTLDRETVLLLDILDELKNQVFQTALILHPGQGYMPVALSKLAKVDRFILADRNLLAIENSKKNLILNKFPGERISILHQVGLTTPNQPLVSIIVGSLPDQQNTEVYEMFMKQAAERIDNKGLIIFSSSSTVISKLEKIIHSNGKFTILQNKRSQGNRVLVIKNKSNRDN